MEALEPSVLVGGRGWRRLSAEVGLVLSPHSAPVFVAFQAPKLSMLNGNKTGRWP